MRAEFELGFFEKMAEYGISREDAVDIFEKYAGEQELDDATRPLHQVSPFTTALGVAGTGYGVLGPGGLISRQGVPLQLLNKIQQHSPKLKNFLKTKLHLKTVTQGPLKNNLKILVGKTAKGVDKLIQVNPKLALIAGLSGAFGSAFLANSISNAAHRHSENRDFSRNKKK